jgi:hypothetical protein
MPNQLKVLAEMGESQITEINLVREPLSMELTTLLNRVSLGEFQKKLHQESYDDYHMKLPSKDFFHLFMEIRTVEGKYILEKNAAVSVAMFEVPPENCEKESVKLKLGDITDESDAKRDKKVYGR